nr:UDP-N-acetylglucosamine 2-epimerase [uncultured Oscillibacter sp.]
MRILSITGNRADYDLMSYLYRYFNQDSDIEFGLVVTGGHLTNTYGSSIEDIKKDGIHVVSEIEDILNSAHKSSRAKATGILIQSLTDAVRAFQPDILIAAGDREDVLAMAVVALYTQIPFLHFFAGDHAESGHVDNLVRHAASKIATAHFTSCEEHKNRLVVMGEEEQRVFNIGSVALDKFREEALLPAEEVMKALGLEGFEEYALLIYHPPAEIAGENREIEAIMRALDERGIKTIVSYPNTDFNNQAIIRTYERYKDHPNFYFYKNLSRNLFINLYRHAMFQVGNSSAGVMEAASIPIPVINVGSRQKKRGNTENVIFVEDCRQGLLEAIDKAMSGEYRQAMKHVRNIFGDGYSSRRAYEIIKSTDFSRLILKKFDPLEGKRL